MRLTANRIDTITIMKRTQTPNPRKYETSCLPPMIKGARMKSRIKKNTAKLAEPTHNPINAMIAKNPHSNIVPRTFLVSLCDPFKYFTPIFKDNIPKTKIATIDNTPTKIKTVVLGNEVSTVPRRTCQRYSYAILFTLKRF